MVVKKLFGLVIDWETTGLLQHETPWRTYLEGPQGIELGAILVELPRFDPIAEFTSRVKFLGSRHGIAHDGSLYEALTWSDEAQAIHGMSVTDLVNAPRPAEVAENFVQFVLGNTGIEDAQKQPIMLCGHNPAGDAYSLRQLLFLGGAERKLRFHHRMLDSFTMGNMLLGVKSSDELFERVSGVVRGTHSALQDAQLTLNAFRHFHSICRECQKPQLQ